LDERNKTRNRILNVLKVVISLGVLVVIFWRVDTDEVLQLLREIDWLPFLGALLLLLSGSLVRAYRWGVLVWALGVRASWWRLVCLYFVGTFFSQFLPTGVGGDAVKMYELSRDDGRAAAAISSVLVDRFLGLFVLFAMALLALIGGYELVEPGVRILIALVFAVSVAGGVLVLQRTWLEAWGRRLGANRILDRIGAPRDVDESPDAHGIVARLKAKSAEAAWNLIRILRELYESLHTYGTVALAKALAASVVWNLILIFGYYLLGEAVGIDVALWYYFLFVPIISVLLMVPSIGGLGVREGATWFLFTRVGVAESRALALALAYLVTLWINALIGAAVYIVQGMHGARSGESSGGH
jgi:uncharacterized protein (TIRG00374 family)